MKPDIGWVDLAMGAFLALSIVAGLLRGLVFELMSLAGWFVAYFAALWFEPQVQPHISLGLPGSVMNHVVALAAVFVVALIVWGLAARLLRTVIRATPLRPIDRLLGAGFGVLRGVLVLVLVVIVVGVTPWSRAEGWRRSRAVAWLGSAVEEIRPFLPFQVISSPRGESYVRHRRRDLEEPRQPVDL